MPSGSTHAPRRVPTQKRGERRVAELLRAAERVMAEAGYEATTMCAIAERAGASIGSLYQFFPNKEAVAEVLRARYIGEVEALWDSLARDARALSAARIVHHIVRSQIAFAARHPAYTALQAAPPTVNSWRRRALIRERIARVLQARRPAMPRRRALQIGGVVHQIIKGILALHAQAGAKEKEVIVEEFEAVLLGYLSPKL